FNTIADGIGVEGVGTFIQNGGTHITTRLIVGDYPTGSGVYTLNSGTYIATNEYIGGEGTATFNQTGGTHIVGSTLGIATSFQLGCTYNMSGGTLNAVYLDNRSGTFDQSGGVATFSNGVLGQGGTLS